MIFSFLQGLRARDQLLQTLSAKIRERREQGCEADGDHDNALTLLLNEIEKKDNPMTERELKESVLEMMFSGHSKTSSAACSVIMLLGSHPHVMDRISAELMSHNMLQNADDSDLTMENIQKLKYVDHVFKEVLRVAPPAGGGFRKALKTFELNVRISILIMALKIFRKPYDYWMIVIFK